VNQNSISCVARDFGFLFCAILVHSSGSMDLTNIGYSLWKACQSNNVSNVDEIIAEVTSKYKLGEVMKMVNYVCPSLSLYSALTSRAYVNNFILFVLSLIAYVTGFC
jgi:hypothetical protein